MDRASEMALVVAVLDRGGFTSAGEALGLTPSAVSKAVTRLETRLGTRLLERTTRRVAPTAEGERYVAAARRVLADIDQIEADIVENRGKPTGILRVSSSISFAVTRLATILPAFRERYPDVELDLTATDRVVDVLAENVDVAIRTGDIADDRLVARRFGTVRRVIAAAPSYLRRHGRPARAEELKRHTCVNISTARQLSYWPFVEEGRATTIDTHGHVLVDNALGVLALGLAGLGIVRLAEFTVSEHLKAGTLVELFAGEHAAPPVPLHLVHPPGRQRLPRVRVFLDHVAGAFAG